MNKGKTYTLARTIGKREKTKSKMSVRLELKKKKKKHIHPDWTFPFLDPVGTR